MASVGSKDRFRLALLQKSDGVAIRSYRVIYDAGRFVGYSGERSRSHAQPIELLLLTWAFPQEYNCVIADPCHLLYAGSRRGGREGNQHLRGWEGERLGSTKQE